MNGDIEQIIVKFLTNTADEKELTLLEDWLRDDQNALLFESYIKANYISELNLSQYDSTELKKNLISQLKEKETKVSIIRIGGFVKYAASILMICALAFVFKDSISKLWKSDINDIHLVNRIETGSSKAILTLTDNTNIELGNGQSHDFSHASSNGQSLMYSINKSFEGQQEYHYITVPSGGEWEIELSDGTKVWLNSETKMKFPSVFAKGETRKVELIYGEAFFDVTSSEENNGARFEVYNKNQSIEVIGTQFNVKAYADEANIYTTLVEGEIVLKRQGVVKTLMPMQQAVLNKITQEIEVSQVDNNNDSSWKDGVFGFEDIKLKELMNVLSRWYDCEVIFVNTELEELEFFGKLKRTQTIEEILSAIKDVSAISAYEINDKTIKLY